ncbi:MAG: hypothetical protein U9R53_10920, partial [Chloroflexota bacterium]|nr:hypothetical protein [Chloroflexota bacterium]
MKERPILFNQSSIKAILEGRKTQTRRIIKKQFIHILPMRIPNEWVTLDTTNPNHGSIIKCRFGDIGDHLWVRETWRVNKDFDNLKPSLILVAMNNDVQGCIDYRATQRGESFWGKWRPSIHMPRWASRISLEIIRIRVERAQNISLHDINAEGTPHTLDKGVRPFGTRREQFQRYWDSIYSKQGYGWDENPWVWIIEFKKLESEEE